MDANLKAKWIAALRSGEYKKGRDWFEHEDRFCALGVLCKVAGIPTLMQDGGNWHGVQDLIGDPILAMEIATTNDGFETFNPVAELIAAHVPAEHKTDISIFCEMLKTQAPLVEHQSAVDTCGNG